MKDHMKLLGKEIEDAYSSEDGVLYLEFTDGTRLVIEGNELGNLTIELES